MAMYMGDLIGKSLVNQFERAVHAPPNILKIEASFGQAPATRVGGISPVVSIRCRQVAIATGTFHAQDIPMCRVSLCRL